MKMDLHVYWKKWTYVGILLFLLLPIGHLYADSTQNPADLIQSTVTALQVKISTQQGQLQNSPQELYQLIKSTVMPYVDIDQMAGLALGPKWRKASPLEQQEFVNQFGLLLTKTYANAILAVSNYKITIYPLRGDSWQTQQYVAVNGKVTSLSNGQNSNLTYYLERSGNSWKIYDLSIEGVSFLKNYQAQFQSFANMTTLLAKLNQLNSGS